MGYRTKFPQATIPDGWVAVDSSCLSRVRVQGSRTASVVTVTVEFRESGSRYECRSVPHDMVADLLMAPSVGTYWNQQMRSLHWRKV